MAFDRISSINCGYPLLASPFFLILSVLSNDLLKLLFDFLEQLSIDNWELNGTHFLPLIPIAVNIKEAIDTYSLSNFKLFFMLRWTIIFLVIALIAALLGFTGVASGAAAIAKIFFYIFIVLFLISLIAGGFRRS